MLLTAQNRLTNASGGGREAIDDTVSLAVRGELCSDNYCTKFGTVAIIRAYIL